MFLQGNVTRCVQCALLLTVQRDAPMTQSTLKEQAVGKSSAQTPARGAKCAANLQKMQQFCQGTFTCWGEHGKDCHTSNRVTTHNSIQIITAPTQAPGVSLHALPNPLFLKVFTKHSSQVTRLHPVEGSPRPAVAGSQEPDTGAWQQCCTNQGTANFVESYSPSTARSLFCWAMQVHGS